MRTNVWRVVLVVFFTAVLTACGSSGLSSEGNDVSGEDWLIEDFTYINQDEESFGLSDLKDEVWLADFIFTHCTTVCIPMSANMVKIQGMLAEEGLDVPIVSFTVDPERDTPEVLQDYAEEYGADTASWHFLTGYSFDEIKSLSETSFKSPVEEPVEGDDQFMHAVWFYLMQGDKIIKMYNGFSETPFDAIVQDAKVLSEEN